MDSGEPPGANEPTIVSQAQVQDLIKRIEELEDQVAEIEKITGIDKLIAQKLLHDEFLEAAKKPNSGIPPELLDMLKKHSEKKKEEQEYFWDRDGVHPAL